MGSARRLPGLGEADSNQAGEGNSCVGEQGCGSPSVTGQPSHSGRAQAAGDRQCDECPELSRKGRPGPELLFQVLVPSDHAQMDTAMSYKLGCRPSREDTEAYGCCGELHCRAGYFLKEDFSSPSPTSAMAALRPHKPTCISGHAAILEA